MKLTKIRKNLAAVIVLSTVAACATKPVEVPQEAEPIVLSQESWSTIIPQQKIAIVLFDSTGSSWLKARYEELENIAATDVSYFQYTFTEEKKDAAIAAKTPAIHLYKNGFLIDKISGKPVGYQEVVRFDRDVKLWMDTTVAQLKFDAVSEISYKFNGSHVLGIRAY